MAPWASNGAACVVAGSNLADHIPRPDDDPVTGRGIRPDEILWRFARCAFVQRA